MKHWLLVTILLLLGSLVLVACGGTENPATTNPTTSSTQSSGSSAQTVNVLLGEMYVKSDVTSFKVGTPYHFVVKNEGKVVHEFTIAKKVIEGNEKARDAASLKDVDNIASGQTTSFDYAFKEPAPAAGMEFECSYPGHYEMGMHTDITVK
ncbi:MAG: hypothetical protein E6J34_13160 [Chloroflexi bacterium]|nr:MAG: hypothetical protein E6J34_13160 [Chloroflexota bacterium]